MIRPLSGAPRHCARLAVLLAVILGMGSPCSAPAQDPPGLEAATVAPQKCRLGREIYLSFPEGLEKLKADLNLKPAKGEVEQPVHLFLNGRPMGLTPVAWDWQRGELVFNLERTAANRDHWRALFELDKPVHCYVAAAATPGSTRPSTSRSSTSRCRTRVR